MDSPLRFMLRRYSLVKYVSVLHGTCLQSVNFFYSSIWTAMFVKNDNSNKGTTARLNETRFGPKKKSSPIIWTLFDALDEREIAR
jgi:hypothetical protein